MYLIHTLKSKRREGYRVSSVAYSPCLAVSTLNDFEIQCFLLPQYTHLCLDIFGRNRCKALGESGLLQVHFDSSLFQFYMFAGATANLTSDFFLLFHFLGF